MIKTFETLYGISKKSKIKVWTVSVEELDNGVSVIHTDSGYNGQKIKRTSKNIYKGKNIGKSNETTPFEQAVSEAQSAWNKKRDHNYEMVKPDLNNYVPRILLPMLAKGPGKGKIKYPCYMQPKLNGICNLSEYKNGQVLHHSRGGKLFEFQSYLNEYISYINPPYPLHGELYTHGWSLQKIGSYTKEFKPDQHLLEFWIYDIAWPNKPFYARWDWILSNVNINSADLLNSPIRITPTMVVNNKEEIKVLHDKFVHQGFEGGMLKNSNGLYLYQYNSDDIEKVKEFEDAEFKIVGGKQGSGLDEGCVIFTCITEGGKTFDVRPVGTVEERRKIYENLKTYIDKYLTVKFPELTDDGIPSQPVGLVVRDYE